jgi:hypothetical protein
MLGSRGLVLAALSLLSGLAAIGWVAATTTAAAPSP